jgi:ferredoxin-NADP reductase
VTLVASPHLGPNALPVPRALSLELTEARALSPTVRSLVFRTTDGSELRWRGGQHVELLVPPAVPGAGIAQKRDYSIARAFDPSQPDRFEIAVTRVDAGPASESLHALPVGARLDAYGPKGRFFLRPEAGVPAIFVAHGTGLSPLRAMIEEALAEPAPALAPSRLTLLAGFRAEPDILWRDAFEALAARHPDRLALHFTLSRPTTAWPGLRGRVQAHVASLVPPDRRVQAYLCGLREMTDDVARLLADAGVPDASIFTEEYD